MKHHINKSKGFTLIELLVVISIIGILSSFAVVSLNDARIKARDAKRMAEINHIYTALQFYFDTKGEYPKCDCDEGEPTRGCWNNILTPELSGSAKPRISPMPMDPQNEDGYFYKYCSLNDGKEFLIQYKLEEGGRTAEIRGF